MSDDGTTIGEVLAAGFEIELVKQEPGQRAANFARNLKLLREERDLSQDALAAEMRRRGHSFHQATVYKIENGSRQVQLTEADDIASILHSSIHSMMSDTDGMWADEQVRSAADNLESAREKLIEAASWYETARELLTGYIEQYEHGKGGSIPGGILEEYRQRAEYSAKAVLVQIDPSRADIAELRERIDAAETEEEVLQLGRELGRFDYWKVEKLHTRLAVQEAQIREQEFVERHQKRKKS